ncbi:MAG: nucleotide sugar dehydrogenase, partial [Negativicutes bacterium]|nr:nucleotide sugar dehydrogenase [Negativicutes bacterium]
IIQELYAPFLHQSNRLQVMPVVSAELTKYAANAMLATRISFMNELAGLCEAVGADIEDIRRGIGADSRIGRAFLYAGAGFGGSCFPKDLRALAQFAGQYNCPADLINAVITVNERQKKSLFGKINKFFGGQLAGRVIAVWGLSFKPHTDDVREAPALVLIEDLRQAGARVRAYDPAAMTAARAVLGEQGIVYCDDEYQAAAGADAIALMTEWPQFRSPDFPGLAATMRQRAIFDGRNQYRPQFVRGQGFSYVGIGRPGDDC